MVQTGSARTHFVDRDVLEERAAIMASDAGLSLCEVEVPAADPRPRALGTLAAAAVSGRRGGAGIRDEAAVDQLEPAVHAGG